MRKNVLPNVSSSFNFTFPIKETKERHCGMVLFMTAHPPPKTITGITRKSQGWVGGGIKETLYPHPPPIDYNWDHT